MQKNTRITWDGTGHAGNIYEVWNYLSSKLRQLGESLREVDEEFYGTSDPKDFISNLSAAIKVLVRESNLVTQVYNSLTSITDLTPERNFEIPRSKHARECVMDFVARSQTILPKMETIKSSMCENVLRHLENYCYDYHKLGTADDRFYKQLRVRISRMKKLLAKFDNIASALRGNPVCPKNFCDDKFSEELAIEFDCERFPVLRACPDMLQKLYFALDIAQDWLRSDKVYMEEIGKQIEQTKFNIKEKEDSFQLVKLEYCNIFSCLKQRQSRADYSEFAEESVEEETNTVSRMEAAKYRLLMEIAVVNRLLQNCSQDLSSRGLRSTASPESPGQDIPDGHCSSLDRSPERLGLASSRLRERVLRNSEVYKNRLYKMKQQLQKLQGGIKRRRQNIREVEKNNIEVERLTRKLKSVARHKAEAKDELHALKDHLCQLEHIYVERKFPKRNPQEENLDEADGINSSLDLTPTSLDLDSSSLDTRNEGGLSADLRRAFRLVKNNIGYGWKDLTRSLSYSPHKGLSEIDNDIRAIEHENPGHLKEQAYQALIGWYNHNGSHATLRKLVTCLRDINENRLADKILGFVPSPSLQNTDISPRGSDSGIE